MSFTRAAILLVIDSLQQRTAICSQRDGKSNVLLSGLSRLEICAFCVYMSVHVYMLACIWMDLCVCVSVCLLRGLNLKPNISIFQQFSLSSPKIGCTCFVASHECLLNLLWRDLNVNLSLVENVKP